MYIIIHVRVGSHCHCLHEQQNIHAHMHQYAGVSKRKRARCGNCDACKQDDCGDCSFCKDMIKFGGLGRKKEPCIHRRCAHLTGI